YRHSTHFVGDIDVREKKEIEYWKARDPIKRIEDRMLKENVITKDKIQSYRNRIQKMVDEAVDFARKSPMPDPKVALEDVFVD
ncbi:unnamed protein product, partial [marine sediment metagenome]